MYAIKLEMAVEVGNFLSEHLKDLIRSSLTGVDYAEVAADNKLSTDALKSILCARRRVTRRTLKAVHDLMRKSFDVNNKTAIQRRQMNQELKQYLKTI